jgi:hypothetical protein
MLVLLKVVRVSSKVTIIYLPVGLMKDIYAEFQHADPTIKAVEGIVVSLPYQQCNVLAAS